MSEHKKKPKIGRLAWHKGGMDPRLVVEVSPNRKRIKIKIHDLTTDWLPAKNYSYTEVQR